MRWNARVFFLGDRDGRHRSPAENGHELDLSERDRLLVIAPHPDDESLATAGLLLRASRLGIRLQVLFLTRGERNSWAQRIRERRILIGAPERKRWGLRRQEQALMALQSLGLPPHAARFAGFPDNGITQLLMHKPRLLAAPLRKVQLELCPNVVVIPDEHDGHRDHNACLPLVTLAGVAGAGQSVRLLKYRVHGVCPQPETQGLCLNLRPDELTAKRHAIACHSDQFVFSRHHVHTHGRMTVERFTEHCEPNTLALDPIDQIIRHIHLDTTHRHVQLRCKRFHDRVLMLIFKDPQLGSLILPIGGHLPAVTNARSIWRRPSADGLYLRIPLSPHEVHAGCFLKLHDSLRFFDRSGWWSLGRC